VSTGMRPCCLVVLYNLAYHVPLQASLSLHWRRGVGYRSKIWQCIDDPVLLASHIACLCSM